MCVCGKIFMVRTFSKIWGDQFPSAPSFLIFWRRDTSIWRTTISAVGHFECLVLSHRIFKIDQRSSWEYKYACDITRVSKNRNAPIWKDSWVHISWKTWVGINDRQCVRKGKVSKLQRRMSLTVEVAGFGLCQTVVPNSVLVVCVQQEHYQAWAVYRAYDAFVNLMEQLRILHPSVPNVPPFNPGALSMVCLEGLRSAMDQW